MSRKNLSRGIGLRDRSCQKIYSIPQINEIIIVNEIPRRARNPYVYYRNNEPPLDRVKLNRYIGKVTLVTNSLVTVTCHLNGRVCEKSFPINDFALQFYSYVVVNEDCLKSQWTYEDLSIKSERVQKEIIKEQVLLKYKYL